MDGEGPRAQIEELLSLRGRKPSAFPEPSLPQLPSLLLAFITEPAPDMPSPAQ